MKTFFAPSRDLAARRLKEGGHRIYDPRERLGLAFFDVLLRGAAPLFRLGPSRRALPPVSSVRSVLALRLDRLGDLVMTLPALARLRTLLPEAEIELGVGSWNEDLARGLPFVDRVSLIDTPWAAWGRKASWSAAIQAIREAGRPDLVIDFQGDVRVVLLMALTRAPLRAGFGDTGGSHLLTHRGGWNEKVSWYRQSMNLVETLFPQSLSPRPIEPHNFLLPEDRERARELFEQWGLGRAARPLLAIHPSAGRRIKQWEIDKQAALAGRLAEATSGTVLLTGGPSDRKLVEEVARHTRVDTHLFITDSRIRVFAAAMEQMDLFITGDTGPMHIAHAVGVPTVAIFGPSDPVRYGPEAGSERRLVLRRSLYCSPCNMIRRPPRECAVRQAPECIEGISVDQVLKAALDLLARPANA